MRVVLVDSIQAGGNCWQYDLPANLLYAGMNYICIKNADDSLRLFTVVSNPTVNFYRLH